MCVYIPACIARVAAVVGNAVLALQERPQPMRDLARAAAVHMPVKRPVGRGDAGLIIHEVHVDKIKAVYRRDVGDGIIYRLCVAPLQRGRFEKHERDAALTAEGDDLIEILKLLIHYVAARRNARGAFQLIISRAVEKIAALEIFKPGRPRELGEILLRQLVKAAVVKREAEEKIEPSILRRGDLDGLKLIGGELHAGGILYLVLLLGILIIAYRGGDLKHDELGRLVLERLDNEMIGVPQRLHAAPEVVGGNTVLRPEGGGVDIYAGMTVADEEHVNRSVGLGVKILHSENAIHALHDEDAVCVPQAAKGNGNDEKDGEHPCYYLSIHIRLLESSVHKGTGGILRAVHAKDDDGKEQHKHERGAEHGILPEDERAAVPMLTQGGNGKQHKPAEDAHAPVRGGHAHSAQRPVKKHPRIPDREHLAEIYRRGLEAADAERNDYRRHEHKDDEALKHFIAEGLAVDVQLFAKAQPVRKRELPDGHIKRAHEAPEGEGPRRAVPQAAHRENDEGVEHFARLALAAAAEGDVEVIREPRHHGDVPAPPHIGHACGKPRLAEVIRDIEAEQRRHGNGHIAVTGEVHIELEHGAGHMHKHDRAAVVIIAGKNVRDEAGKPVGKHELQKRAPEEGEKEYLEAFKADLTPPAYLRKER